MNKPENVSVTDLIAVEVLAPAADGRQALGRMLAAPRDRVMPVFSESRLGALNTLSQELLKHPFLKRDPAAVALAFWLRLGHLKPAVEEYVARQSGQVVPVPAGLVFHIAPANVDTMFVYSWALSFAAGNADVVRLSSERSPLMGSILECINACMLAAPFAWAGSFFVSYGHNDEVTGLLSGVCDQRVIWGGDETVRRIRAVPLNPHAGDRAFASKFSFAVLDAAAFCEATDEQRRAVLGKLVVDIAAFGQNACSSPHLLIWLGAADQAERAIVLYEGGMASLAGDGDMAQAVRRITRLFEEAVAGDTGWDRVHCAPRLWSVRSSDLAEFTRTSVGAGVIRHGQVSSVAELAGYCGPDDQTIVWWGLSDAMLRELAAAGGARGVDRVVPVGKALDFNWIWDGFNLLDDFVRKVALIR